MYKLNHKRTRAAAERIGLALFIAGVLHMALNETIQHGNMGLAVGGLICVIITLLERE